MNESGVVTQVIGNCRSSDRPERGDLFEGEVSAVSHVKERLLSNVRDHIEEDLDFLAEAQETHLSEIELLHLKDQCLAAELSVLEDELQMKHDRMKFGGESFSLEDLTDLRSRLADIKCDFLTED